MNKASTILSNQPSDHIAHLHKVAFDNSEESITIFDQNGKVIVANKRSAAIIGSTPAQMVGKTPQDYFPEQIADRYSSAIKAVFENGNEVSAELPVEIEDQTRWFKIHLKPLNGDQDKVRFVLSHVIETTNHKNLIDQLNQSHTNLKILLENSNDLIFIADKNCRMILFNDAMAEWIKFAHGIKVAPGLDLDELSPSAEEREIWRKLHQRVLAGESFREEVVWSYPVGGVKYFEASYQPFYEGDQVVGFSEFSRDMSKRKLAELALAESEERFRQLAENINEVFWIGTPDWNKILYISPTYEEVWGRSCESLYLDARNWWAAVVDEDQAKLQAELEVKISGDLSDPHFPEYRIQRPDGTIRWISARSFPIHNEQGEVIRIAGIAEDITERKLTEDAIRKSEARYRKLFSTMFNGFVLYEVINDEKGNPYDFRVIQVNRAFEDITSLKAADVIGRTQREILPDADPFWIEVFIEVATTGISAQIQNYSNAFDKYFNMYAYRPEINQFAVLFTDVTKEVLAEKELQKLNEELENRVIERTQQLERKNKDLESFSYSVSHDLRAPLRAISGFGQILLDEYAKDWEEEPAELLELMVKAGQKMDALIDGLLVLSRISQTGLNIEKINLSDIARQAFGLLSSSIHGREINFTVDETPMVYGDPRLMEAVVTNLISNAIKFTDRTKVAEIKFGFLRQAGRDIFFVQDNGIGFSMEYKEKLFTPFQRFETKDDYEGTGIGLTIVKQVIERHHGKVWAESQRGQGTTIYFHLGPDPE